MGGDRDLDVEVTGRPGAGADLALTGELDPGAGVDARGTRIFRVRRVRTRPSPEHSKQGLAMTVP